MNPTLPAVVAKAVGAAPRRTAIQLPDRGVPYDELWERVGQWAAWLARESVPGERVGVLLPNSEAVPLALFGIHRAGGTALLLNPLCSPREIGEYVKGAGANRVLTLPALASRVPPGTQVIDVSRVGAEASGSSPLEDEKSPAEDAVLIYTAAMHGWARAARLTHTNLVANLHSTTAAMAMNADDVVVAALPLIHAFGLTVTLNAPLSVGATVVPLERFHPARLLDLLESTGATVFAGVPAMYATLLDAASRRGTPKHALRLAICGGAPLPRPVADAWEQVFGIPLRQGYGLTEAAPVCLFNHVDRPNRIGTLGSPFPGVDVTLRDEVGNPLPDGTTGEICVSGDNVFPGYLGEGGRRPEDFFDDAFRTGDLGMCEADGAIRFMGIRKAMFTRNGFNVYPREVERALEEDPRIARAVASSVPNSQRENDVALAIHPAPDVSLSEEDVREICRDRLATYKQPGPVTIE